MMAFDPKTFRSVLARFPTGVTIVAGVHDGEPIGLTANSFSSVSLDPPLVSFCAGLHSTSWPRLSQCQTLAVNVLGSHQQDLATKFARSGPDKFAGVDYHISDLGSPMLGGTIATFDCEMFEQIVAGDHIIVLLKVIELSVHGDFKSPLVFYSGAFHSLPA